ncbi:MAG: hypothetical protein ACXWV9_04470 [Flavisolibacter sp.]
MIVFIFLLNKADAQQLVSGYIKDSLTHFPVSSVTVLNESSRIKVHSDSKGFFYLYAQPGDLLQFTVENYKIDTLRFFSVFTDTIQIFLSPRGEMLEMVTVASTYSKYQLDSMKRKADFNEMRGTVLNTVSRPQSGFGLSLNLDRIFKKKYSNQKKEEKLFEKTEVIAYVQYRFSSYMVAQYTGLKGDALRDFMYRYTPSYQWLRQHTTNEEVVYYISEKLKLYKQEGKMK